MVLNFWNFSIWPLNNYFITLAEEEGIVFGSVCLSTQNFRVFLRNRLSDWDKIFTIGATTHVKCFNHNYDVIGHVVRHRWWKTGKKNFRLLYLWNRTKEKMETWHIASTPHGEWVWFVYDIIIAYVEYHIQSAWTFLRVI